MMREHGGNTYRPWDPQRSQQAAHSPAAKLPEGDLGVFLLDTVPQWDVHRLYAPYEQETRGAPPCDPAMMVCRLRYAYSVGGARRNIALACERPLACLAIVGQERPDFRTISALRKWYVAAFQDVLVQGVRLAGEAGLAQVGNVATDGKKAGERVREAIAALGTQAYQQDEAEAAAWGSRRGEARPDATAQSNVTAPALPRMRTNNKGWEDCGNAPARVDGACQSICACEVPDASHDKQQAEPGAQAPLANLAQAGLERRQDEWGSPQAIPAPLEHGEDREAAVAA
jgi:hypothetical protein